MTELYVPYIELGDATYYYLLQHCEHHEVMFVDVSADDWAHTRHFQAVWARGRTFVNLEHDIVPWPGAVDELVACPWPWCFFGYRDKLNYAEAHSAPFGLVKFDQSLMRAMPQVWQDMETAWAHASQPWRYCDIHFFAYATERGHRPHQHTPAVLNAHPPSERVLALPGVLQRP